VKEQSRTKSLENPLKIRKLLFKYIFRILIKFPIPTLEKTVKNLVQPGRKAVSKFELPEIHFERTVRDKSRVEPTWSQKITILSKFLESSLNLLFNNLKKHYKILYSQGEKRC